MMVLMAIDTFAKLSDSRPMMLLVGGAAIAGAVIALSRPRTYRCSDISCRALVPRDSLVCASCGSSFARAITPREWRDLQEQEMERKAAAMDVPDCADCQPEDPCAVHAVV